MIHWLPGCLQGPSWFFRYEWNETNQSAKTLSFFLRACVESLWLSIHTWENAIWTIPNWLEYVEMIQTSSPWYVLLESSFQTSRCLSSVLKMWRFHFQITAVGVPELVATKHISLDRLGVTLPVANWGKNPRNLMVDHGIFHHVPHGLGVYSTILHLWPVFPNNWSFHLGIWLQSLTDLPWLSVSPWLQIIPFPLWIEFEPHHPQHLRCPSQIPLIAKKTLVV